MMSGTMGPRMLVRNDITKNTRKTKPTMKRFRVTDLPFRGYSVVAIFEPIQKR